MFNRIVKTSITVTVTGLIVLGVSACSTESTPAPSDAPVLIAEDETVTGGENTQKLPPLEIPVKDLGVYGSTNAEAPAIVTPNNAINITGIEDADMGNWTGTSSNEEVAVFSQGVPKGENDEAGSFVGFQTKNAGTAELTLTNNATGETYVLTVNVVKPNSVE